MIKGGRLYPCECRQEPWQKRPQEQYFYWLQYELIPIPFLLLTHQCPIKSNFKKEKVSGFLSYIAVCSPANTNIIHPPHIEVNDFPEWISKVIGLFHYIQLYTSLVIFFLSIPDCLLFHKKFSSINYGKVVLKAFIQHANTPGHIPIKFLQGK